MKQTYKIISKPNTILGVAFAACLVALCGQSRAEDTPPDATPDTATAAPAESVAAPNPELIKMPSRLIQPDQLGSYSATMLARLDIINNRKSDPFGQVQDPTAKPKIVKPTSANRQPTSLKKTSFSDIISRIQVNTIKPTDNKFLIGTREFKLGDQFPINYRGRKVDVKVVGVTATSIDFEKIETGEVSSVELKLLPPGMSAGADGLTAPGMVSDNPDAPLQIDSSFDR